LIMTTTFTVYVNLAQADITPVSQQQAETVVNDYFLALTTGDTSTIKSLLGGSLLEKRKRLLNNPSYPAHLMDIYNEAQLEITGNTISNKSITIDATITLNSGKAIKRRYLLKENTNQGSPGQFTIYSESDPEEQFF
jgi:hypothetical protein